MLSVEVGGVLFLLLLRPLHDSLATENDCSGNDGADKLFWYIKNFSSCCFLAAIKFFSHFIGKCQCKYAVNFFLSSVLTPSKGHQDKACRKLVLIKVNVLNCETVKKNTLTLLN